MAAGVGSEEDPGDSEEVQRAYEKVGLQSDPQPERARQEGGSDCEKCDGGVAVDLILKCHDILTIDTRCLSVEKSKYFLSCQQCLTKKAISEPRLVAFKETQGNMTNMRFNFLKDGTGLSKVYTGLTMSLN